MRRLVTFVGVVACVLLAVGGCARVVTAPAAEPEAGVLVAYTVVNGDDGGVGSLRQVVAEAPTGATVTFDAAVTTVNLTSGPIVVDKDLTIAGPEGGTVTISGGGTSRVLDVKNGGYDVVLRNLTITGGRADWGAGVWVEWGATLEGSLSLFDCTVAGNHAVAGPGGGLYVHGTLRMERTTVRDNSAADFGGGVFHNGTFDPSASIVNSTFTGNVAQIGGAIHNNFGGLTIAFSTITGNRTTLTNGGGVSSYNDGGSETRLRGTIVVGNTTLAGTANDLHRMYSTTHFVTLGYNLVGTASGFNAAGVFTATGDVAGLTDVGLAALADNGGPTQTLALGAGSPAIDAVPASACLDASGVALGVDQRGELRPEGPLCDIGAYEAASTLPTYVVTHGGDDGPGSLRQTVLDAPAGVTITFAPAVTEVALASSLVLERDVTIAGPADGTVTLRGDHRFPVVRAQTSDIDIVLRNLTIRDGYASDNGGGVQFKWPEFGYESGTAPAPSLRLERCTVVDNYAAYGGGGIYAEGDLLLDATTVVGNVARDFGGGLFFFGTDVDSLGEYTSAATILNSTITGNSAEKAGGLFDFNGELRVLFSTITANVATIEGGGVLSWNDPFTRTTFKGTIAVGNTAAGAADDVYGQDATNRFDSRGYNVIGIGSGSVDFGLEFLAPGDLALMTVADTGLLPLVANGGPTLTHALAATSVVLDRVPPDACTDLAGAPLGTDQRGVSRPQGMMCDPGAFELEGGATAYFLAATVEPGFSGSVDGGGMYLPGTAATLTATPAAHWQFSHWSGDLTGSENPVTFTMNAPMSVVANFVPVLYPVIEVLDGGGSVLRDPSGTAYAYGTTVKLTAVPTADWGFSSWSGDVTGPFSPAYLLVTGPMSYTAHFIRWYTLKVDTVGGGIVEVDPVVESFPSGDPAKLTATADAGWHFTGWSGDLTGDANPATVKMDADKVITATFVQDAGVGLQVTIQGSGEVTPDPVGPYAVGDVVTLTATPAPAWFFQTWSGALSGSANPATLTIAEGLSVTAVFQPVLGPMLTVTVDGAGRVTSTPAGIDCGPAGGACATSFRKNASVTLHALPDPTAAFLGWTGAASGGTADVTIRLNADKSVAAGFVDLNGPVVTIDPSGSARGSTAIVSGSLVCATGSHDLEVGVLQEVQTKDMIQLVSASTTLAGVPCGQPWTAALAAEFGRFVRGEATVTVTVGGVPTTANVRLR